MLVAVYGTLKRGERNNVLLEDAEYIGTGVTLGEFSMHCVGFPVVTKDAAIAPVRVELYRVNAQTLAALDRLEGNGRMYQRERRYVRRRGKASVRAWIYIGLSFDPRRMRKVEPVDGVYTWPDAGHYSQRKAS